MAQKFTMRGGDYMGGPSAPKVVKAAPVAAAPTYDTVTDVDEIERARGNTNRRLQGGVNAGSTLLTGSGGYLGSNYNSLLGGNR